MELDIDKGTAARLNALARGVGLPVTDILRTLSHASPETLRRLDLRRVMREAAEREPVETA